MARQVRARSVVLASGARYRRLDIANLAEFEGTLRALLGQRRSRRRLCAGQEVALAGAGNSAGQAVVYLAGQAKKVWMVVRGQAAGSHHVAISGRAHPRAAQCRSAAAHRNLRPGRRRGDAAGAGALEKPRQRRGRRARPIGHLFSFIGADPNTDWLADSGITLDDKGFVITGDEGGHPLATSRDGIFAVGDVRCGSVKRVAAAVGEGATVVSALHAWLAKQRADWRRRRNDADTCTHLDTIRKVTPSALGCEECLKLGENWFHLRICRTCGHVGCCDQSKGKHATKHFHRSKHPIIEGYDPPEGWGWCYVDEVMFDLGERCHAAARSHSALLLKEDPMARENPGRLRRLPA